MPKRCFKGCPFCCSRRVELKEIEDPSGHHFAVWCLDCECEGPLGDDVETATSLWNQRPCEGDET
jgi:hypothetical protein